MSPEEGSVDDVNAFHEITKALIAGCTVYGSLRVALRAAGVPDEGRMRHHAWASKGMHIIHAVYSSVCGLCICRRLLSTPAADYRSSSNGLLTRVVWWETGYYIYDTAVDMFSIVEKTQKSESIIVPMGFQLHHLIPLTASLGYSRYRLYRATKATDFVVSAWLAVNASTVFQHLLWILDKLEVPRTSSLYRSVLGTFLLLFVSLRKVGVLVLLKAFSYMKLREEGDTTASEPSVSHAWSLMPLKCRVGTVLLTAINTAWLVINVKNKAIPSFFPAMSVAAKQK